MLCSQSQTGQILLTNFIDLELLGSQPLDRLTFNVLLILSIAVWSKTILKFWLPCLLTLKISQFNSETSGFKYILDNYTL